MEFKLGSWLFGLAHADRLSGIERVSLEIHQSLSRDLIPGESLFGILPKSQSIHDGFPKYPEIARDVLINSKRASLSEVDALWLNCINPTGFHEILVEKESGLKVVTPIWDIFPLQKPTEFLGGQFLRAFKVWLTWALKLSDTVIFTSDSQYQHFKTYNFGYRGRVEVLDLGSSIVGPIMPSPQRSRFGLLAVSTIEPRKRYVEILDAFDVLRALGFPVTLDIVGRYGWLQEEIRERILEHDNYGEYLRWHENCSDAELTDLYRRTSITIMASRDEGWGLALEEGLRHGHKIVARDIPIFRKRENPNVLFFDQSAPLAETIASALFQPWKRMKIQRTMMDFSRDLIQILKSLV